MYIPDANVNTVSDTRYQSCYCLTVIIPVYNTSNFLEETLGSIAAGAPDDTEYIIINDGSTDNSVEVARRYVQQASLSALIITTLNAGLGAARNTGLRYATGEYISFVDSDDWFDGGTYRRMYEAASHYKADMVFSRSTCFHADNFLSFEFPDAPIWDKILGEKSFIRTNVHREPRLLRLEPNACVKMIRMDFAQRINFCFPEGLLFEDLPAHVRTIVNADQVLLMADTGLYYRVGRPGQITSSRNERRSEILTIIDKALAEALAANISVEAGAGLAGMAARMLYWCGQMLPVPRRQEFFEKAISAFASFPATWWQHYHRIEALDDRERLIIEGLVTRNSHFLVMMSQGARHLPTVLQLASSPHGTTMRRLLHYNVRDRLRRLKSRILR